MKKLKEVRKQSLHSHRAQESTAHQLRHILLVFLLLELAIRPVQAQLDGFICSHALFQKGKDAVIPR